MFKIGDHVVYSVHGVCRVTDICEKTVLGETNQYYILKPIEDKHNLTISAPVDNKNIPIQEIMDKEDALELIDSFKETGLKWLTKPNQRKNSFSKIVKSGDRNEIAKLVNTLMRKRIELVNEDKKLNQQDSNLLKKTKNIFLKEMSLATDLSVKKINNRITKLIKGVA